MKKVLFLVLALVLAVGLMTACRSDNDTPPVEPVTPPAPVDPVTPPPPPGGGEAEVLEGYGEIVNGVFRYHEPVHVRALYSYNPARIATEDTHNIWMLEWARYYMNLDIEIVPHSFETTSQIFNLAMAAGDYTEAFFFFQWGLNGIGNNTRWGEIEGILRPLQDFLFNEEIMPNLAPILLNNFAHEVPILQTAAGNIFQIVTIMQHMEYAMNMTGQYFWVDTRVLDALGREMPRTTDDFLDFLRDVRDTDPMGLGSVNNIPLGGRHGSFLPWGPIMNAMGFVANSPFDKVSLTGGHFIDGPGELVSLQSHPNFFEFLVFMNTLFTEGLFDQDFFTQEATASTAKVSQDFHAVWPAFNLNEMAEDSWRYYQAMPPMTSHVNSTPLMNTGATQLSGGHALFLTHIASDLQAEAMMRFIDLAYCPDFRWVTFYGPEYGVHHDFGLDLEGWEMVDGARVLRDVNRGRFETRLDYLNQVGILHNGGNVQDRRTDGSELQNLNLEDRQGWWWHNQHMYLVPYLVRGMPGTALSVDDTQFFTDSWSVLNGLVNTGVAQFVTGARPLTQAEFEAYYRELQAADLDRHVEMHINNLMTRFR